jgi:hypothetical protein
MNCRALASRGIMNCRALASLRNDTKMNCDTAFQGEGIYSSDGNRFAPVIHRMLHKFHIEEEDLEKRCLTIA